MNTKPFATVRTSAGYDVVDLVSGVVVGEMERRSREVFGSHARTGWTCYRVIDGSVTTYAPYASGYCAVAKTAAKIHDCARGFLRTLTRSA